MESPIGSPELWSSMSRLSNCNPTFSRDWPPRFPKLESPLEFCVLFLSQSILSFKRLQLLLTFGIMTSSETG